MSFEPIELSDYLKLQRNYIDLQINYENLVNEYTNYRRRTEQEKDKIYFNAFQDILTKLFPILDNLNRATSKEHNPNIDKGIQMINTQLLEELNRFGVEEIGKVGEIFNPEIHDAVSTVTDSRLPANRIIKVYNKGYKIGNNVLRPASVIVTN